MTFRAVPALVACAVVCGAAPARAYSADWPDTVALNLARTQIALERCPELEPDWARREMPKATGLGPQEMERRVAAILPGEREKLTRETGALLCPVLYKIYGPDGIVPYFLKRR